MKFNIKVLICLLCYLPLAFAYNPAGNVDKEYEDTREFGEVIDEVQTYNEQEWRKNKIKLIDKNIDDFISDQNTIKTSSSAEYFVDHFEFDDISLYCPPIKDKYKNTHYSMIDNINFKKGGITCSVYEYKKTSYEVVYKIFLPELVKLETKSFINSNYIESLNEVIDPSHFLDEDAVEASNLFETKIKDINTIARYKYLKNNEDLDNFYLDKADILDALVTQNTVIIDQKATIEQNQIVFNDGYIPFYENNFDKQTLKNLEDLYNLKKDLNKDLSNFGENILNDDNFENRLITIQNNNTSGFQKFYLTISKYVSFVFIYLWDQISILMILVLFGIAIVKSISYAFEAQKSSTKFRYIAIPPLSIMFVTMTLFITNNTKENSIIPSSNIQDFLITPITTITNKIADEIVFRTIEVAAGTIINSKTITSLDSIINIISFNEKLKRSQKRAIHYDKSCQLAFKLDEFKNDRKFKEYFQNIKNNEYIPESILFKKLNINYSIYDREHGYATQDWEKNKISVNSCYNNKQFINNSSNVISYNNLIIERFNNIDFQEVGFKEKEILLEQLYNEFYKKGYLAIGSIQKILLSAELSSFISRKTAEYERILASGSIDEIAKFGLENIFLTLTIGDSINTFYKSIFSSITNAAVGWIPFGIGSALSKASSGVAAFSTTTVTMDMINSLLPILRTGFLSFISSLFLYWNFLVKLWLWLLSFFVIYTIFIQPTKEKIFQVLMKLVSANFKLIVIIIIIYISFISIDFIHISLFSELEELKLLFSNGIVSTAAIYTISGALEILIIFIEALIGFYMMFKLPSLIFEFLEVSTERISELLNDAAGSIQHKIVK